MSDDQLARLAEGIRKAHEAGNQDHVRALGAEYRRLQSTAGQPAPALTQNAPTSSVGDALISGFDRAGANIGSARETIGNLMGWEGVAAGGTAQRERNEAQIEQRNFQRPEGADGIWKNIKEGDFADAGNSLLYGAAENLAPIGTGAVATAAGAGAVALGGPAALVSGGIALGSTILGGAMATGDATSERRENAEMRGENPDAIEGNWGDVGTGIASGLLELVPGKGGYVVKLIREGGQEAVQESLTIGNSVVQDGQYVPEEVAFRLLDAATLGSVITGGVDATLAAGNAAVGALPAGRTDNREFSPDEIRAAEALMRSADGDMSVLGNVSDVGAGTAKGAASAALDRLRSEAAVIGNNLRSLARAKGDDVALVNTNNLIRQIGKMSSTTPQADIDDLVASFPETADAQRLASLARQVNTIQDFTMNGTRDMGGLSAMTRRFDITDKRSQMGLGAMALAAGGSISTAGGATVVNRMARGIDRMTNRRSRVKRFVDSALKDNKRPSPIDGVTAPQALEKLKQSRLADTALQNFNIDQAKERARGGGQPAGGPLDQSKAPTKQEIAAQEKAVATQAKAEARTQQYQIEASATEDLFEPGVDVTPDDPNPVVQGHYLWQQATGLPPADTLAVMEQLAREGRIPQDAPQRFREDIRSFKNDENTPLIQRMVAQRAGSTPNRNFNPKPKVDPDAVMQKLDDALLKGTSSRGKQKAAEGDRRYRKAVAALEQGANSLNPDQYESMFDLIESINSPGVTRAERFQLVNEMLPLIFPKRTDKGRIEMWRKTLAPLSAIGNDYRIDREKPAEVVENEAKDEAIKKRGRKAKKQEKSDITPAPANLNLPPVDKAESALKKLNESRKDTKPEPKAETEAKPTAVQEKIDATEPKLPEVKAPSTGKKSKLADRVQERVAQMFYAIDLAQTEGPELEAYIQSMPSSTEARIEQIFYEEANDRLTVNQVADKFAARYDVPPYEAAQIVASRLQAMQEAGKIKVFKPFKSDKLKFDGKYVTDENGKSLEVLQIEYTDPELANRIEVAKAIRQSEKMVPQGDPEFEYTPATTQVGAFSALKDIPKNRVDGTFWPLLDFVNKLRGSRLAVSDTMLTQIEDALAGSSDRRLGEIAEQLLPKTEGRRRDEGPMRTVAQLIFQMGPKGERAGTLRQEWKAGANGRVYSINGMAHTQAGDLMKGILRSPTKAKVGGEPGLKYLMHGIGNLLGYDKKSPYERRNAMFDNDLVDSLVSFAEKPFARQLLKKEGKDGAVTRIGEVVNDGEGFFQVLNAAHEVKAMVDFARARHKDKSKLTNSQLLQDPAVKADLETNYETDFIVQLDASNNAYQIAGMVMGNPNILRATGILPQEGNLVDPDTIQGADIYLDPAKDISARIPEIDGLGLPDSKLRKVFKKPIGTFLYAAEYNSRKEAFRAELGDIAKSYGFTNEDGTARIVGMNETDGLIPIDPEVFSALNSEGGYVFTNVRFDVNGDIKSERPTRVKIVEKGEKFSLASAEGGGQFKTAKKLFTSKEEAARAVVEEGLYVRMNRELIRDMNMRYPEIRQYLNFAETVSNVVKGRGGQAVAVPTKDGMVLEYSFKQVPGFIGSPVNVGGQTVNLGVRTPDTKLAGRGLAAFMTHQNDAWALRETYRRLNESGGLTAFNPIHDSYGFHPLDAERGQQTWVEVMQELGSPEYNLFVQILEANGISFEEYVAAGGNRDFIVGRQGVAPVPPSSIPTALS